MGVWMAEGRITWWDRLDFIPQAMQYHEKRGSGASLIQPVCEGNAPGGCKGTNSSGKWLKAGRNMTDFCATTGGEWRPV